MAGGQLRAGVECTFRSTPIFVDGVLYTVAGQRRQVVAIDPATGELLWAFREPETMRYRRSPRTDFRKGVAYAIDYTPELKRQAMEILSEFRVGGLYVPALPYPHDNDYRNVVGCVGGMNIYHPPVADPTTGILYASHGRGCSAPPFLVPMNGEDVERGLPQQSAEAWRGRERHAATTATTVAAWAPASGCS